jgi:transposase
MDLPAMRPKGSKTELESRRFQAYFLYCQGKPLCEIADSLNVNQRTVKSWVNLGQKNGLSAFTSVPHPGNPKPWKTQDLDQLRADLQQSPGEFGFSVDSWNGALVAKHIENRFGIRYHKKYIQEFLRNHSLSVMISSKTKSVPK